jgi:NTE family protein
LSSVSKLFQVFSEEDRKYMAILDESPLEEVLDMAIDFDSLLGEHGKEFYAAVYPSAGGNVPGAVCDTLRYVLSRGESVFPRLKDFGREDARRILMASSAIPVAFRAIDVKGETFRDGGMGDRVRVQGNTPARPLADAGCTHAVVVTLDQGVLWDRNEWPEMTALEIRPTFDIAAGSSIKALVNFSPVRIQELIDRGERDAMQCLGDVSMALGLVGEMRRSQSKVQAALATELEIDRAYNRSMDTIRGDLLK